MEFKELIQIYHKKINKDTIILLPETLDLCSRPYRDHPKGCPNIEKCKKIKVPNFGILNSKYNFKHFYLIYAVFNFKKYIEIRIKENPEFFKSPGRLQCNRYWQNSVKKQIKKKLEALRTINPFFYVLGCGSGFKLSFQNPIASMEKVCINVFSTMKLNSFKLEIKPKNRIVLCNLLCSYDKLNFKLKKEKYITEFI